MRKLVVVLGVPIDNLTMSETIDRLDSFVQIGRETGKTHQVATVNADFAVKSLHDPELRLLLREADMATADGMPLVWGARLLGIDVPERVAGADIVPALAERAAGKGYSIYFFGAADGIAQKAADRLKEQYPNLKIAGVASPPFGSILEMDRRYIEEIKQSKADIVLVALGNPKQEKWIGMYGREIGAPVAIGIGGTLDFMTGQTKRAPAWMQKTGLEWVYRLLQEPQRLWKRYVHDLFGFSSFFVRQWWMMRQQNGPALILPKTDLVLVDQTAYLTLSGRLDRNNYEEIVMSGMEALKETGQIEINLKETTFLDSSAIGGLVLIAKQAREQGGDVCLKEVPSRILQTLTLLKLDQFFEITDENDRPLHVSPQTVFAGPSTHVMRMPRRLDANTAETQQIKILQALQTHDDLLLDFSETRFLASAGLASLAHIQKEAQRLNKKLRLANCSTDVRRVIKMVRFDSLFEIVEHFKAPA